MSWMRLPACLYMTLALAAVPCVDALEPIHFDSIEGAKRWDRANGIWELAFGGPLQLFADGRCVHAEELDVELTPNAQPALLCELRNVRSGLPFTCVVRIAKSSGGVLSVQLRRPGGECVGESLAAFGSAGSLALHLTTPDGNTQPIETLEVHASASGPAEITQVACFRRFEQLFEQDTVYPLQGIGYRDFGPKERLSHHFVPGASKHHRTRQWRGFCPVAMADGIGVGVLDMSYYALLCAEQSPESGMPVPLRTPGGCRLAWRGYDKYTLPLTGDCVDGYAYRNKAVGRVGQWQSVDLAVDPTFFDSSNNGIWSGVRECDWHCAGTLATNYGQGKIDYLVLLPQNRIAITPTTSRKLRFRYLRSAAAAAVSVALPNDTNALGFVFRRANRFEILGQHDGEWRLLHEISDTRSPNRLEIESGSLGFEVPDQVPPHSD